MERDRESVGLTSASQALISDLDALGWFSDAQDAARFCMAYAMRSGVAPGTSAGTDTRWAAGNFDKTGEIRALIMALYPTSETPVRLMEYFVNEGLRLVADRVRSDGVGPSDLLV
ncbi:MAG TPA: hypothetical protein VGO31_07620 [Microbacteriaceae bacterium]|jgi:hypothetical protein|nr:hypothetical protein [Microbacteriaceae bacterium]